MFPCPWCSPKGPHLPPNTLHHLWGQPPTMGGPPNILSSHKGLPPKGGAPKNSPHDPWDLVPSRWDKMFSATIISKKFQKVPEHFRHPLKLSGRALEHFQ
jgi:hypothetical protein